MCSILIVDDDPQVRDLASRALSSIPLSCHTAGDFDEALERFDAGHYDVVCTDLVMPGRHGHALAVDLLSRPEPPKVVVMTALREQSLIRDLMARGVKDVLLKPFDFDVLAWRLLSLVDKPKPVRCVPPRNLLDSVSLKLPSIEEALIEITALFPDSLSGVFELDSELSPPPKAVSDFIARYAKQEEAAADQYSNLHGGKRAAKRAACSRSAVAVPVDKRLLPAGEPFMAAIRDVSETGIRLLHTRATNAKYLALRWEAETVPDADVRVIAELIRCTAQSPFYSISGRFLEGDELTLT